MLRCLSEFGTVMTKQNSCQTDYSAKYLYLKSKLCGASYLAQASRTTLVHQRTILVLAAWISAYYTLPLRISV